MIWAALLAALFGAGIWLLVRALVPPSRSLRTLSAELAAPAPIEPGVAMSTGRGIGWLLA